MVKWLCFQTAYCLSLLYGCEVVDKNIEEIISLSKYMIVCVCVYIYIYIYIYACISPISACLSDNECYNYSIL